MFSSRAWPSRGSSTSAKFRRSFTFGIFTKSRDGHARACPSLRLEDASILRMTLTEYKTQRTLTTDVPEIQNKTGCTHRLQDGNRAIGKELEIIKVPVKWTGTWPARITVPLSSST